jgi:hypothetical protein
MLEDNRITLEVSVRLDPVPGAFHTKESAKNIVAHMLKERIGHYDPKVTIPKK